MRADIVFIFYQLEWSVSWTPGRVAITMLLIYGREYPNISQQEIALGTFGGTETFGVCASPVVVQWDVTHNSFISQK